MTTLPMCVDATNCQSTFLLNILFILSQKTVFPNADVIKLLIQCGVDVNTKNEAKSTPLHVACQPYNYDNEVREAFKFLNNAII